MAPNLDKIQFAPEIASDHAPLKLSWVSEVKSKSRIWRLSPNVCLNIEIIGKIKKEIKKFYEINDTAEIKSALLWDALKA